MLNVDVEAFARNVLFIVREKNQGWILPMFWVVSEAEMEVVIALVKEETVPEDEITLNLVLIDVDHGITCRISVSCDNHTPLSAVT